MSFTCLFHRSLLHVSFPGLFYRVISYAFCLFSLSLSLSLARSFGSQCSHLRERAHESLPYAASTSLLFASCTGLFYGSLCIQIERERERDRERESLLYVSLLSLSLGMLVDSLAYLREPAHD